MSSIKQLFLGGSSAAAYQIERSLRFNSADSANLNRTWSTPTNAKIGTLSFWCKRSKLGDGSQVILQNSTNAIYCGFDNNNSGDDKFGVYLNNNTTKQVRVTTQVFRDASAWYHFVLAIDTANGTAANRLKLYVNGVQVSDFSTSNTIDQNIDVFTADTYRIGSYAGSVEFLDGYLTEVHFIDGSAKTPSDFGETDTDTGVWKPKAYSGSYGTNGFYLKFADNSGTTSTTLGKDSSGNGNNWTPNNFSVTAGAGNDSLVDTPTPYGTDTGAGGEVRGNYATLNPLDSDTITLSNGNLQGFGGSGGTGEVFSTSTIGMSSGKWYCEVLYAAKGSGSALNVGIIEAVTLRTTTQTYPDYGYYSNNGNKYNDLTSSSYGASWDVNDVIGISYDADAGTLVFYKNGSSQGTAFSGLSGTYFFCQARFGSDSHTTQWNFGQRPFAYTAPSGFKALCTQNLPTPTIGATATTRADDYFNTLLYTGTGSSLGVTGVGFQPDFVWIKERSEARSHALFDVLRGATIRLYSDSNVGDQTETTTLTAFNTDGFTVSTSVAVNNSAQTYASWNWKANGAGVSNTAGSISSTVSANTTAGFSIVTYTGNATAGATVGHGCQVNGVATAPSMIIVKDRVATSGAREWVVYHSSLGNTQAVFLNTTGSAYTGTNLWNNTSPTSTVFTVGNSSEGTNGSGNAMLAYCFAPVAGYSAFGSYTGNGADDGPFNYLGFRAAWILVKRSSSSGEGWWIYDNKRSPYNIANVILSPDSSGAELSGGTYPIDINSNGFKIRGLNALLNTNGATYVYAAFAEVPTKFSLAR